MCLSNQARVIQEKDYHNRHDYFLFYYYFLFQMSWNIFFRKKYYTLAPGERGNKQRLQGKQIDHAWYIQLDVS